MKFPFKKQALLILALGFALLVSQWGFRPVEQRVSNQAQSIVDQWGSERGGNPIAYATLPPEAKNTLALIQSGGPFPYSKDGTVFGNREGLLPKKPRGYYTEYTVPTPGASNRGARRIVAGEGRSGSPATSGEYWYTDDHYRSFRLILMVSS